MAGDNENNMLPEFLDENDHFKAQIGPITSLEELVALEVWINKKEDESSRQSRPAWIEVVWAIINLSRLNLEASSAQGGPEESSDFLAFDTHIVARQVAKQKGERQIPTRYVTDEIKRIAKHQLGYIDGTAKLTRIPLVGWYRFDDRRCLGIAMVNSAQARLVPEEQGSKNTLVVSQSKESFQNRPLLMIVLAFVLGVALSLAVLGVSNTKSSVITPLESIQQSKLMKCGVDGALTHFSLLNDVEQTWWGLDVELCKALGAALDVNVEFVKVGSSRFENRVKALLEREIDILFRNTSHTVTRDLNSEIAFGPIYYYEREVFLDLSAESREPTVSLDELKGKKVCVKPGSSNAVSLQQINSDSNFQIVMQNALGENLSDNVKFLRTLRQDNTLCDFVFGNFFVLKQLKLDQEKRSPNKLVLLKSLANASFDPLAPVLLRDYQWKRAVSHTIYALLYADKLGINSYNVEDKYTSGSELEKQFLQGYELEDSGLGKDWVYRAIFRVGNYSEIYYRSIECDYVSCNIPSEHEFHEKMNRIEEGRWPNLLFDENHVKPGLLQTPRF